MQRYASVMLLGLIPQFLLCRVTQLRPFFRGQRYFIVYNCIQNIRTLLAMACLVGYTRIRRLKIL